jgi:hypothetical protein
MRTPEDPLSEPWKPLGERLSKPVKPPEDKEVAPGVWRRPDGRLYTDIPLPKEKL